LTDTGEYRPSAHVSELIGKTAAVRHLREADEKFIDGGRPSAARA